MTDGWTPIGGWEGLYEAHPDGLIRSLDRVSIMRASRRSKSYKQLKKGRVLKPNPRGRYLAVNLVDRGRKRGAYVHLLIAETFIGPRPLGLETCHNDGDLANNAASNLRYATHSENMRDAVLHGTQREAARSHCAAGHEYTPENTAYYPSRKGRVCLTCFRKRGRDHMRRKRAAQREAAA